ncbi:MAG: hypothetical protein RLZZ117_832 [Cyanobacteriota bacterium]
MTKTRTSLGVTSSSGADAPGPISSSTISIGGESFSVDPRSGSLNYCYTFFSGNVNYGQTPFTLALQYQQNAAASYVGAFTDSDNHAHPYGASGYLPTPEPKATEDGSSQLDDAGGVWDLNLPLITISTSKVSKFYGKNQIAATVSLGDISYQYLFTMPNADQSNYLEAYTTALLSATSDADGNCIPPLYSVDGRMLTFLNEAERNQILVQDKYGTRYLFTTAVLFGYKGIDIYDPTYNSSNNANADQLLVYRITNIFYANGQTLNFSYSDLSWTAPQQHTIKISDSIGNSIASVNWSGNTGLISLSNQQGDLVSTHQLTINTGDCRIQSVTELQTGRSISYMYLVNQAVPYAWQNQTSLAEIINQYTKYRTTISYQQFNTNHGYDAGCNQFSLAEIAVAVVQNYDDQDNTISCAEYDFGFSGDAIPNFVLPQKPGKKSFASGLNHWLDNIFYDNLDSDGCSSSDRVNAASQTYQTTISTLYPDTSRNRQQVFIYDALGRSLTESINAIGGPSNGHNLSSTSYVYTETPAALSTSSFVSLPYSYGSPTVVSSTINCATLNGIALNSDAPQTLILTQSYVYDEWGNPTKEVSPLGQVTEYAYWPAEETFPANERLIQMVKTYSIGDNGASYVQENQNFQTFHIPPTDGGFFMPQICLPISNQEFHYDAASEIEYAYRTDLMGGYIGGNNYSEQDAVALNGMLTQRCQQDNTGISDVVSTSITYTPSISNFNGQKVLCLSSSMSGTTSAGEISTQDRGGGLINFMGYPLQQSNVLGQITSQSYDNLGRLVSVSVLAGTELAQVTTFEFDLSQDLELDSSALFSRRKTDAYGNVYVQLFDARQRHIATYQTLAGCQQVQIAAYSYDNGNNLIQEVRIGNAYKQINDYYYSPGTGLLVATVPNEGLAQGKIFDALNGTSFIFSYEPAASSPTTIEKIYGSVKVSKVNNTSQLLLADGLIDADAATNALAGFDLVALSLNGTAMLSLVTMPGNPWVPSTMAPAPLQSLYQTIAVLPQAIIPTGSECFLMEYNTYTYDAWNRRTQFTRQTFVNSWQETSACPTYSETVTRQTYDTPQRSITYTYPQGQQVYQTYNLTNGLQAATLMVAGISTELGRFSHDGLGRVVTYIDSLNGSEYTATYTSTGLLNSRTDAYGNSTVYSYDPVTLKLIQSSLTPAAGGTTIAVIRQYDSHLNLISASDKQGNQYQWNFAESGWLQSQSLTLADVNPDEPFQTTYSYDNYGDLVHVADPFLPYPDQTDNNCLMVRNNLSNHGFNITRDGFGRVNQLMTATFHGVNRNFAYHPVTGLLLTDSLANLPTTFGCADTGTLSLATTYGYDNNLRVISKSITRSDLSGTIATAQFTQSYDTSNRVACRSRTDFQGLSLNETFAYDLQTGALLRYTNDKGSAAPSAYLPAIQAISNSSYSYDLYGNLIEVSLQSGLSTDLSILRCYTYSSATGNGLANPFRLLSIQEQNTTSDGTTSLTGNFNYDCAGNTTRDAYGRSYSYDAHGLIQSIQCDNNQTEEFTRDGLGRLVQRTAPWLEGTVHDFGVARFLEGRQLWQTDFFAGTAAYTSSPAGSSAVNEQPAFVSIEDLGRQTINTIGYGGSNTGFEVLGVSSYLPFGTTTNLLAPETGYPANLDNSVDYPSSVMGLALGADSGTGLRILGGYRVYDPVLGRFLQWDSLSPFGKGGMNGYAYAGNDPVNFWDPSGQYRSVKAHRYGPKPLEAHHHSNGGFWDGFLAGFKHGIKAFYMTPYNYAKSFGDDLAHGHWVGALKMGFDLAVDSSIQAETGLLGTMALQEFVSLSPSSIFSGKSPIQSNCGGKRNAYQWGYSLGSDAGSLTDSVALAVTLFVVGAEMGALGDMLGDATADSNGAVDSSVTNDAANTSRLQITERTFANEDGSRMGDGERSMELSQPRRQGPEESTQTEAKGMSQETHTGWQKAANWVSNNWIFRNVILPHDPQDPFPWDEGLSVGQRAKAFVTLTGETISQGRSFINHLASWGGSTVPGGTNSSHKSNSGPSTATRPISQDSDQGLDPIHQSPSTSGRPYSTPSPPPLDLPGR